MTILENIGLIAIFISIFFAGKYLFESHKKDKLKFNEKATILIHRHPKLEKDFEKLRSTTNFFDGRPSISNPITHKIFGVNYKLLHLNENIEKELKSKIKSLEKYASGTIESSEIIKLEKLERSKQIREYEIDITVIKLNYLKYYDSLKTLMPDYSVSKDKESIISELMAQHQISRIEAEIIFEDLNSLPSHLIHKDLKNDKLFKLTNSSFSRSTKELQNKIDDLTFKYH